MTELNEQDKQEKLEILKAFETMRDLRAGTSAIIGNTLYQKHINAYDINVMRWEDTPNCMIKGRWIDDGHYTMYNVNIIIDYLAATLQIPFDRNLDTISED